MRWKEFLQEDRGQDVVEFSLLLAFVVLASAALFFTSGASIHLIWSIAESNVNAAGIGIRAEHVCLRVAA